MKRAFLVAAVSIVILLSFAPNVFRVSAASGLADTINSLAGGINWSNTNMIIQHTGYVFHYLTTPNYSPLSYPNAGVQMQLGVSALNYFEGTGSPTDWSARAAGYNQLPDTYQGGAEDFLIYYRWACNLYNWFSDWNKATALSQFSSLATGTPSLDYPSKTINNNRYYDEWMETADIYLALGSISNAISTFEGDYATHWNGAYWGYNGMSGTECEAGFFAMLASKLYVANGNSLQNFDTVVKDMVYKFLANGWNSPQWGSLTTYVCTHYADTRLRLQNDVGSWAALQMLWTYLTPAQQATMTGMLTGNGGTSAWQHLMQSLLYQPGVNKFISMNGDSVDAGTPNDAWTSIALEDLFFKGIVPGTGSLAIPLTEQMYEDIFTWFLATNFGFNYAGHQIKIPVRAGTINFLFGTTESSANFPSDGIYTVQFSNDWNSVQSVNRVGGLTAGLPYLPPSGGSQPPTTGMISVSSTYNNNPIGGVVVTVSGPTPTTVTTSASGPVTTGQLSFGSYTLTASYNGQPLSEGAQISVNNPSTSVTFQFTSVIPPTGIVKVYAEYGGQNIAIQVTGTGPNGWSQIGTTSANPNTPLSYTVAASTTQYVFSGSYNNIPKSASVTVTSGGSVNAILDFGGGNDNNIPFQEYVIIIGGVASAIAVGGVAIGLRGNGTRQAQAPPPKKGRRKRRS
jgi:hypothetical protein